MADRRVAVTARVAAASASLKFTRLAVSARLVETQHVVPEPVNIRLGYRVLGAAQVVDAHVASQEIESHAAEAVVSRERPAVESASHGAQLSAAWQELSAGKAPRAAKAAASAAAAQAVILGHKAIMDAVSPTLAMAIIAHQIKIVMNFIETLYFGEVVEVTDSLDITVIWDTRVHADEVTATDGIDFFDLHKLLTETVVATDSLAKNMTREGFTDSATPSDTLTLHPTKVLAESVTPSDAVDSLDMTKVLAESVTVTDVFAFFFEYTINVGITSLLNGEMMNEGILHGTDRGDTYYATDEFLGWSMVKPLADAAVPSDAVDFFVTKPLSDSVAPSDALAKSLTKDAFTDSVALTDDLFISFNLLIIVNRGVSSVLNGEVLNWTQLHGNDEGDEVLVTERLNIVLVKPLADSAVPSDAVDFFDMTKSLSDSVAPSDALAKSLTRPFTDSVALTDDLLISFNFLITVNRGVSSVLNGEVLNWTQLHGNDEGDEVLVTEKLNIVLVKPLTDSAVPSDALAQSFVKGVIAESVTPSDTLVHSFAKGVIAESVTVSDSLVINMTKAVSDSVTIDDADLKFENLLDSMLNGHQLNNAMLN